ncbi:hypothetical protein ACFLR2_00100 [Chlamydiota bacterium]
MDSSATRITGRHSFAPHVIKSEPSQCKTIGFAIVIILGLGSLAVAGVGLGGYLPVGSLSSLGQVNSIIMMAAGGGGGIVFLTIGIVGSVKNRQKSSHTGNIESVRPTTGSPPKIGNTDSGRPIAPALPSIETSVRTAPPSIDTHDGRYFGPEAYGIWGAQVVGPVEAIPERLNVKPGEQDPFFGQPEESLPLLYIPDKVLVKGEEQYLTLNTLEQISGKSFYINGTVKHMYGHIPLQSGWRRMSRGVIPGRIPKTYAVQKSMVETKEGYRLPYALEVVVFRQLVEALRGNDLNCWGRTYCIEVSGGMVVYVHDYGSVDYSYHHKY